MLGLGQQSGSKAGRSNSTGPSEGQGAGQRDPGTPEGTSFEKKQIHPNQLDPTGRIVGTLPLDGNAPKGEAALEVQEIIKAAQIKAEKVEREAIPIEYKEQVRRYMEALHPTATPENSGDKK